jgi:alpha-ribazole phosphatase/probable phosphoglycerate mutase
MLTLDLLRHGEPVGGRRYRGQIDDPLSERGWAQMRAALGDSTPWTRIVSSPLARCRAFAEELSRQRDLPLSLDDRLREVGFGVWEGRSAAEIESETPGALARFKSDPVHARPLGAEALDSFYVRVAEALEAILSGHDDEHVLLVGHAGVIRMALAWALAIPQANAYRIEVASAKFTRLRFDAGRATLVFHGGALPEQ